MDYENVNFQASLEYYKIHQVLEKSCKFAICGVVEYYNKDGDAGGGWKGENTVMQSMFLGGVSENQFISVVAKTKIKLRTTITK